MNAVNRRGFLARLLHPAVDGPPDMGRETAASRVEAYLYGNILILAALASLQPGDIQSGHAALLVGGTAISTFVAHALAESIGHRIRAGAGGPTSGLRRAIRNSVPIASAGSVPVILLVLGYLGLFTPTWMLVISIATIVVRFLLLGSVTSYFAGERNTWRRAAAGLLLGFVAVAVAVFKLVLTH